MNNIFRQRLKHLRERRGISCKVLSELCGLASDAIRRYEHGESEPSMTSLMAIADFFEVSTDFLIGIDRCERKH
jgi:transcriptional regulator with XRE-family HTH domain